MIKNYGIVAIVSNQIEDCVATMLCYSIAKYENYL
jgi:hypothetical protein